MSETFTPEMIASASAETDRLSRELDITNADHIALWLEANAISPPLTHQLSWISCQIAEAYEMAETRGAAGFNEAANAWRGILDGMKRFGMESEAIELVDEYFADLPVKMRAALSTASREGVEACAADCGCMLCRTGAIADSGALEFLDTLVQGEGWGSAAMRFGPQDRPLILRAMTGYALATRPPAEDAVDRAKAALASCADALESELRARYPMEAEGKSPYPATYRRYTRDMADVIEARAALAALSRHGEATALELPAVS